MISQLRIDGLRFLAIGIALVWGSLVCEMCQSSDTDTWIDDVKKLFQDSVLIKCGCVSKDFSNRLWNCDETEFCTSDSSKKVLVRRGSREMHETCRRSGREYITVLDAGSASGVKPLPYKCKHLYNTWYQVYYMELVTVVGWNRQIWFDLFQESAIFCPLVLWSSLLMDNIQTQKGWQRNLENLASRKVWNSNVILTSACFWNCHQRKRHSQELPIKKTNKKRQWIQRWTSKTPTATLERDLARMLNCAMLCVNTLLG